MTMLTYTILTDPAPLEASVAGAPSPSMGTVYLVVANTEQKPVAWSTIQVDVPVGPGADHLTSDINKIKTNFKYVPKAGGTTPQVTFQRQQGTNAFHATVPAKTLFKPGDYLILTLEKVTVAPAAGVAVLMVTEKSSTPAAKRMSDKFQPMALVKTAPKELPAPRDFHPDKAMVDAGEKLTLRWEGPASFGYKIMYPGAPQPVPVSGGSWSDAPKRATTYILIATDPNTQQQHFLTTTVQVSNPILEALTAIKGVTTPWVQGATEGDGAFTFSKGAMHVRREFGSQEGGALYAGGIRTEYVSGPNDADGDITFLPGEVKVWRNRGSNDRGTLYAGKADLTGVNTEWVQGRNNDDGWISFLRYGVQVYQGGTNTHGAVYADSIRAKDAPYGQGGGWINLHDEGITVYLSKDGSNGLGNVTARAYNR
ncbi:hypothetical protein [Nonomuraea sp. B19D2]|uniref:hypothetical protein n=1 Tax=Nonomuraea sp. B19D2 TaxID=3159561 RepID=UPI0032DBBDED